VRNVPARLQLSKMLFRSVGCDAAAALGASFVDAAMQAMSPFALVLRS
jgi:hypothetical protein